MYKIVGSIVIYNADKVKLNKVISSFLNSTIKNTKLCLVDNSPKKLPYIEGLLKKFPEIDYIFNNKNLGYGAAHNVAIKKYADSSMYHVVLNPDIYFDSEILGTLYSRMEKDKTIGLSSTKILFNDGKIQFSHKKLPSPFDVGVRFLIGKLPILGPILESAFKKLTDRYELKDIYDKKSFFCPSVSGCFMFFRSNALKEIKGFDEKFFMYFEDVDISRRCLEKYNNIVFNDIHIFHFWERGSYKSFKLLQYHIQSAINYFNKFGWIFDNNRKKWNKI